MRRRILTVSYNDQGISWGPAVHFLELWNSIGELDEFDISGLVPNWSGRHPIIPIDFELRTIRVPNVRMLRQVYYDILVALTLLKFRKDIIYIRSTYFHLFTILVLKLLSIRPVIELNGIMIDDVKSAKKPLWYRCLVSFQEKALIRRARGCIAVSPGIARHAEQIGGRNVKVIPNGVSRRFSAISRKSLPGSPLKIVYVGTFTSWDGAKHIIRLAEEFPEFEFIMIGDGAARDELQSKSPSNMIYRGFVEYASLPEAYAQADAGIVLYEAKRNEMGVSSMKILEYLASGLPVFTTDVPGNEFIRKQELGVTGNLNRLTDDFKMFVDNFDAYKTNAGKYGQEDLRNKSWHRCAVETVDFIDSLAERTAVHGSICHDNDQGF